MFSKPDSTNEVLRKSCRILYARNMNARVTFLRPATLAGYRGAFLRDLIDDYGMADGVVADRAGIKRSTMSSRLRGLTSFFAEEIEAIAKPLRLEPLELFAAYLSVTMDDPDGDRSLFQNTVGNVGLDPTTSSVNARSLAIVTPIRVRGTDSRVG